MFQLWHTVEEQIREFLKRLSIEHACCTLDLYQAQASKQASRQAGRLDKVHGHLFASLVVSALFIERHILLAAIQDDLVAASLLADLSQHLDDALAQPFPLAVLVDDNVLDVTAQPGPPQELVFDKQRAQWTIFSERCTTGKSKQVRHTTSILTLVQLEQSTRHAQVVKVIRTRQWK